VQGKESLSKASIDFAVADDNGFNPKAAAEKDFANRSEGL